MNHAYIRTVQLLLDVAPAVFDTHTFAMKGGTAINLFVQDMPRLSVDIDVVFVPHTLRREDALKAIASELSAAQHRVQVLGYEAELRKTQDGTEAKMFVRSPDAEVKVEVNFVFRGTVLPPQRRSLTPAAQQLFAADIQIPVLADAELYGSKLVAALDRQHPRDLFDVQRMLARHGWDETLLDCFVVYLAGHNRPTHEVLFPKEKPLETVFAAEFEGMTLAPVALHELLVTRQRMLTELPRALLPRHRNFLLSMLRTEPDWSLLPQAHLNELPALQWKLQNLLRLKKNAAKFKMQHDELAARLNQAA
ncbi:MAG: nucleotidyl transferase AbiEii/AbiGii toxin family protein [Hydrogenophaga sp.]|nr:nucleotidyl transferase AbiEii/AbiGii toxin family protein [Hydrogenophaga sp.]MDP2220235.1 nucleotidyl transferase AbiEii/AbiGii toxin family protein [Hydrogenophaga sp.]